MIQNLKTIKSHTLKAHLDRIQNTAEELAQWAAGEVLAGRLHSSHDLGRLASGLLNIETSLEIQAAAVREPVTAELEN